MQNEMNYSLIVWDDVNNIPFPEQVKELIKNVKWPELPWQAWGLPIIGAKYTISGGKTLYLEETPDGKVEVHKQDFTGDVFFANYFVDEVDPEGYNYLLELKATLLKGEVVEVVVISCNKQSAKEYRDAIEAFKVRFSKNFKRVNSWWYKWIYKPWYYTVRIPAMALVFILMFLKNLVIWIATLITPI